jgi:polyhydroxyalkanoate synthesis repressor PhaR
MLLVKKYPNRRLYDTRHSRYITLEDLARLVREGADVSIEDAQSGRDLTQETLTQIILERGGGRILPTKLLLRLIRLDDEAFGEFLTRYVSWALEVYLQAKQRARSLLPLNPLATAPFAATDAIARLVLGAAQWASPPGAAPPPEGAPPPPPSASDDDRPEIVELAPLDQPLEPAPPAPPAHAPADIASEMARLRLELDALKESFGAPRARTPKPRKVAKKKKKAGATSRR